MSIVQWQGGIPLSNYENVKKRRTEKEKQHSTISGQGGICALVQRRYACEPYMNRIGAFVIVLRAL